MIERFKNKRRNPIERLIWSLLRIRGLWRFHYAIPDEDRDEQERWND